MERSSNGAVWIRATLLVIAAALVVGLLALRSRDAGTSRSDPSWSTARHDRPTPAEWGDLLRDARVALRDPIDGSESAGAYLAAVSVDRPGASAIVGWGEGDSRSSAVAAAARQAAISGAPVDGTLKISVLLEAGPRQAFDEEGRAAIDRSLDGLWLPGFDLLLLPDELLARRLVNSDGDLQAGRLRRYLNETGRAGLVPEENPGAPGLPYVALRLASSAEGPAGPARVVRGNVANPDRTPNALLAAAVAGGDYLLRHQHDDGSFRYAYEPKWDGEDDRYNLLRHAGSCYALAELTRATGDPRYAAAAGRGLDWLLREHVRGPKADDAAAGASFEAIVSPGEEAKLGGAALAILALLETGAATGDTAVVATSRRLAEFVRFQQGEDGRFESKYFYGAPDPVPFESIYYPGEAILALARLHRRDPEGGWLDVAARGADWLIDVRDAGKVDTDLPHDHWLLMGLEELHDLTGDDRYLDHARRIAGAIVAAQRVVSAEDRADWVGSFYDPPRSTPTATRAEGLVAATRLFEANGLDASSTRRALDLMAGFQLRCQLDELSGLHLPRPDRAAGGFRRSLTNWEVRIDYVQHNVSALLGIRSLTMDGD